MGAQGSKETEGDKDLPRYSRPKMSDDTKKNVTKVTRKPSKQQEWKLI